ncbi:hypothetical protein QTP88_015102 [Uroleucon formosanum]
MAECKSGLMSLYHRPSRSIVMIIKSLFFPRRVVSPFRRRPNVLIIVRRKEKGTPDAHLTAVVCLLCINI